MKRSLEIALRYGVAVLAVGAALGIKLLLDPLTVQDTPFLLVFGAIIVSAWYGGLGPGLLATAVSALAKHVPTGSFKPNKPISARLCNQEDLLTGPQGTMGDRTHKQLAESIKACLADLKY